MKLNNRLLLFVSIIIIAAWLLMRRYRKERYEISDRDAIDSYITNQEKLDPEVVKEMATKLTTDEVILSKFYTLASADDRLGLFKLTSEF